MLGYLSTSSNAYGIQHGTQKDTDKRDQNPQDPVVEVITPDVYNNYGADGTRDPFSGTGLVHCESKLSDKMDLKDLMLGFL
ncbi:hypothetical protein CsSME_00047998 [Camellia sinensis var. sinensis]